MFRRTLLPTIRNRRVVNISSATFSTLSKNRPSRCFSKVPQYFSRIQHCFCRVAISTTRRVSLRASWRNKRRNNAKLEMLSLSDPENERNYFSLYIYLYTYTYIADIIPTRFDSLDSK